MPFLQRRNRKTRAFVLALQCCQPFWGNIEQWIYNKSNIDTLRAIFGIPHTSKINIPVNYLLIVTRHYIYSCKLSNKKLSITGWQNYVKQYIQVEKMIAIKNDKVRQFNNYWEKWLLTSDL